MGVKIEFYWICVCIILFGKQFVTDILNRVFFLELCLSFAKLVEFQAKWRVRRKKIVSGKLSLRIEHDAIQLFISSNVCFIFFQTKLLRKKEIKNIRDEIANKIETNILMFGQTIVRRLGFFSVKPKILKPIVFMSSKNWAEDFALSKNNSNKNRVLTIAYLKYLAKSYH